ncbi:hypothetical protein I4F81_003649 [Pyropia yezoensis]|uniref:Uncharacterized protein n=1 Tax=Pyropia yezoensis TaxID=2788 RepID=A0ACC3BTJ0_PYRYE|nr:hypothetical protein I4F81_003649 [Neopyropia yezoensis]
MRKERWRSITAWSPIRPAADGGAGRTQGGKFGRPLAASRKGNNRRRRHGRGVTGRHSSEGSTAGPRRTRGRSGGAAPTQGEQYGWPAAAATGGTGRRRRHGGGVMRRHSREDDTANRLLP